MADRLSGPAGDSGDGAPVEVGVLTDDEYLWEPVPGCWSIRRRHREAGPAATMLVGAGEWGRDASPFPHPWPPSFTTLAWRLNHLTELLHHGAEIALLQDLYRRRS